ncbi:MAG: thioredoxin domain-containing protein [Sphingomonadaceae bacterium]|nr:thioredoxin domain-containing protein [Sphingomonadaceae bacterium]
MRAALLLAALLSVAAAKPADWTRTVTQTPTGAYVLGNPHAKVRLVEYLSYTCPHCAHFAGESAAPLRKTYVARGAVAVELRNAVRDRLDFADALAARCGGAGRVFGDSEAIFAAQDALIAKAEAFEKAGSVPAEPNAGLKAMARGSGLTALMAARGLSPARLDACLVSKPAQDQVLAMTKEAWDARKISGTPAFLINDTLAGGGWAQIEPQLRAAVAAR